MFPVDINKAAREMLLRVPGLGAKNVDRILTARRWSSIHLADLVRLHVQIKKAMPFIIAADHRPRSADLECEGLRERLAPAPRQLDLLAPESILK